MVYKRNGSLKKLQLVLGHSNLIVSITYLRGLDVSELMVEDMPNLFFLNIYYIFIKD